MFVEIRFLSAFYFFSMLYFEVQSITALNFRPFGRLIDYPYKGKKAKKRNLWRIVLTEPARKGWRIAYLIVRDKAIRRMEKHSFSYESFEPVKGKALLFVALRKDFKGIRCFRLDKPIILNKGVWHGIITTSDECEIKITEDAKVKSVYWPLGFVVSSHLIKRQKQKA